MEENRYGQEMRSLVDQLNRASDAYYNGRGEQMTDYEWDAAFDRLKKLEEESGVVLPDSPTHRVSADEIAGRKEAHEYPALSLAKTKLVPELVRWAQGFPVWISWKLDGLTLVVTYDGGRLKSVVTRGNGQVGTNITHLAGAISGILPEIPEQGHLVVRGEAVISYEDFERFLLESGEDYANPRNLASGSLSLKNAEEVKKRRMRWIPFTLVYTERRIRSWGERMDWLDSLGFSTVEREAARVPEEAQLSAAIRHWTDLVTGRSNPYPVDGLVVVYDDTEYAAGGSVTGHHAARAGIAFKWQDESADTALETIEWSCAASTITPVAVFSPVELEGTTIRRASLCNISECERLGIGGPGTEISVIKANKIIPKVIRVIRAEGELRIPEHCPICGSQTEVFVSPVSDTRTLRCTNAACPAKALKKFTRFVSKEGMDIDGISEQTLARFISLGWVREYADLFRLSEHGEEIAQLDGFGEKSAANILQSVEKARTVPARRFLYALCIPLVGTDVAKRLLSSGGLSELIEKAKTADREDLLAEIDGIGPEKSASFIRWFRNEENAGIAERLLTEVRVTEEERKPADNAVCSGLTFVITGDVHRFRNRNELKAWIEDRGGRVTGAVSSTTSFLINNDILSSSGKNKRARELNIPVISEEEFLERFDRGR